MSATTLPAPPTPSRARSPRPATLAPQLPPQSASRPAAPAPSRHGRGGRVLFEVPFHSAMTDAELARLARVLDISTHMHPKMRPDPNSPGVVRLDHFSGLFLERDELNGQWILEARTWGNPAPETMHEWHLLAASAARQLDRTVKPPQRLQPPPIDRADRLVGSVENRRFAALRRRLVGLR